MQSTAFLHGRVNKKRAEGSNKKAQFSVFFLEETLFCPGIHDVCHTSKVSFVSQENRKFGPLNYKVLIISVLMKEIRRFAVGVDKKKQQNQQVGWILSINSSKPCSTWIISEYNLDVAPSQ